MNLMYVEEGHGYFVVAGSKQIRIPSITQIMRETGITKPFEGPACYGERGTEVHALTELMDNGTYLPEFCSSPEVSAFMLQYEIFLLEHDVEVLKSEQMVFDERLMICGRYDRLWSIAGHKHLTDIKTTSAKQREHLIQVVFYAMGEGGHDMEVSNLYLHEGDYKLHQWTADEATEAIELLQAMSKVYWFAHPRDWKDLQKLKELGNKSVAKDEFFFN